MNGKGAGEDTATQLAGGHEAEEMTVGRGRPLEVTYIHDRHSPQVKSRGGGWKRIGNGHQVGTRTAEEDRP